MLPSRSRESTGMVLASENGVRVMAGEDLLADGSHFFVVDGDDAVVMRKCDLTVAARIPHQQIPGFDADLALATNNA